MYFYSEIKESSIVQVVSTWVGLLHVGSDIHLQPKLAERYNILAVLTKNVSSPDESGL